MNPNEFTLVVVSAITPIFMGVLLLAYMLQRKVYAGFGHWVAANFVLSSSYLFGSLRQVDAHPIISIVLANILAVYTEILVYEGIRLFFGHRAFSFTNYLILFIYTLVQLYFTFIIPNISIRIIWYSIAMSLIMVRSGMALWNPAIPELTPTARSASILVLLSALLPILRAIHVITSGGVNTIIDDFSALINIATILTVIGWAFYYFFLTSARLELELHQAREEMAQIAITDPLTGLHNRRYLMEHGAFEFERAKRERYPVSIVFIDLDNLKTINDKFGHEAGDMALNFLTHTLQSEIRPYDLAVRFGGDEFILLLPNTHTEEAASIAERIRTKAGQTSLPQKFNNTYIYLSLGVASSEEKDTDIQQVLQRADGALYQAKNEGRNRVIIH